MTTSVQPVPLLLSQTHPDFESLVMQLQLFLAQKATWIDLLTSSTGQTLIEQMAAVGTFNQFAIESAAREGFLQSAIRSSSIYAITRMLGVRISRKDPASVSAILTCTVTSTSYVIPKFSQFTINGTNFFNRDPISFSAGVATSGSIQLYEGTVNVQTIAADSSSFRELFLNEPGFVVSDQDVEVVVVNATSGASSVWTVISEGIWTAGPLDEVYYDSTAGTGDTVLAFGDGYTGKLPAIGSNIVVSYVTTTGSLANNGTSGLPVVLTADNTVSGITTSGIAGGADENSPAYYKAMAPYLYRARSRAVTPPDYKAIASSYPGIASCTIQTQKDIAPFDLRWMNVVRICLLPEVGTSLTDSEWTDFESWMLLKNHAAVQIQNYNPVGIVSDVTVTIALLASALPASVVPTVDANIRALFARDINTLGKHIALSDIWAATNVTGVDYTEITTPSSDLVTIGGPGIPNPLQYFELGVLTINTVYSERATSATGGV